MKITMRVNRASVHPQLVDVTFNGETAKATISMLEVEMHDEAGTHGSWAFRVNKQSEVAALKEQFPPGSTVTIDTADFHVVPEKAPETQPTE